MIKDLFYVKISHKDIRNRVQSLMAITDAAEREQAFTDLYIELSRTISKKSLDLRSIVNSNAVITDKYKSQNHRVLKNSMVVATTEARRLVSTICKELDPENGDKYLPNEKQYKAIRDAEIAELRKHNALNDLPTCMETWDKACYASDLEQFQAQFVNNNADYYFSSNRKSELDRAVSEYYYKTLLVEAELNSHTKLWRFFHPGKVEMYENYIKTIRETLLKKEFNPQTCTDAMYDILREDILDPHDRDIDDVKTKCMTNIEQSKNLKNTGTFAQDKIKAVFEKDNGTLQSFFDKVGPIFEKYGVDVAKQGWDDLGPMTTELNAKSYDMRKDINPMNGVIKVIFDRSFSYMMKQAMKNNAEIDVTQMLKDARKVAVLAGQQYTVHYDAPEFAKAKEPPYMDKVSADEIADRIGRFARMCSFEDTDKLTRIKSEAMNLFLDWKNEPSAVIKEDLELAEQYGSKRPNVTEEVKEQINGEDIEKQINNAFSNAELALFQNEEASVKSNDNIISK